MLVLRRTKLCRCAFTDTSIIYSSGWTQRFPARTKLNFGGQSKFPETLSRFACWISNRPPHPAGDFYEPILCIPCVDAVGHRLTVQRPFRRRPIREKVMVELKPLKFATLQFACGSAARSGRPGQSGADLSNNILCFENTDQAASLFNLERPGYIYSRIANPTVAVWRSVWRPLKVVSGPLARRRAMPRCIWLSPP